MKNKTQKKPESVIKSSATKAQRGEVKLNDLSAKKGEEIKGGRRAI